MLRGVCVNERGAMRQLAPSATAESTRKLTVLYELKRQNRVNEASRPKMFDPRRAKTRCCCSAGGNNAADDAERDDADGEALTNCNENQFQIISKNTKNQIKNLGRPFTRLTDIMSQ